jgi:hypothetical protein
MWRQAQACAQRYSSGSPRAVVGAGAGTAAYLETQAVGYSSFWDCHGAVLRKAMEPGEKIVPIVQGAVAIYVEMLQQESVPRWSEAHRNR